MYKNGFYFCLTMVQFLQANEHISAALQAHCCIVCAGFKTGIEVVSIAAVVKSWVSVHTKEISLTVVWLLIESVLGKAEALSCWILRAFESEVAGSIAVRHNIGPIAVIGL